MTDEFGVGRVAPAPLNPVDARAMYIHVPYCASKCSYCDFNSRGPASGSRHNPHQLAAYSEAVVWETEEYARLGASGGRRLSSCYVGGGTPTVLGDDDLRAMLGAVRSCFGFSPRYELTVEANPGTVGKHRLDTLLELGVNRISFGVQSLKGSELAMLGRVHSPQDAIDAVMAARLCGFKSISVDIMFGLPGQTIGDWLGTLAGILEMKPEHISAYCLKLEDGTRLASQVREGHLPTPDDDLAADMMEASREGLSEAGYGQYEISNYALPGHESRHNLTYWRYEPYIGIGAGAVGFSGTARYTNEADDREYARAIGRGSLPVHEVEELSLVDRMGEACFMGLRVAEGLDVEGWPAKFGSDFSTIFGGRVSTLIGAGLLEWCENGRLRLTRRGVPLGDIVFQEFLG